MVASSVINVHLTEQKAICYIECIWDFGRWQIKLCIDQQVKNILIYSGFQFNLKLVGALSLQEFKGFLNRLSPAFHFLWARRRRRNGYLRKVAGDWFLSVKNSKVYLSKDAEQDGIELNSTGIRQWNEVKHSIFRVIQLDAHPR